MTSRLKRKLEDAGIDTASRKANENFVLIGTPLPSLDKTKDIGEFVPLWKQEVRDEKGRRRLHGAFTGGFSAGYFNTVGSKEGWAPSTFVSSRSERAKAKAARPEDFMDEEDLQDIRDSQKLVDNTEQMDFTGSSTASRHIQGVSNEIKDPLTSALESTLLPTARESVGAKILMKMGWRIGNGIGKRLTLKKRKEQDANAIDPHTGMKLVGQSLNIADDDEEANKHTYPPRDIPVLVVKRKDNFHGLGYVPELSLNDRLAGEGRAGAGDGKGGSGSAGPRIAGGFGLGALNDADEDDLDVYDGDQAARNRHAYDHIAGDEDEIMISRQADARKKKQEPKAPIKQYFFSDGRPVISGFVVADTPLIEEIQFPIPDIPAGWKPDPTRVWDKENAAPPPPPRPKGMPHAEWKKSQLSATQRGDLLGEERPPTPQRSIFDFMSSKDKERIQRISASIASGKNPNQEFTPASHSGTGAPPPPPTPAMTKIEPHVAHAALRGFQPFTADPAKQARYTAYLMSQADPEVAPALKPLPNQRFDEFMKEQEDYAKAASLFKPISGAMAGRFTSAAHVEVGPKVVEGLHQPTREEMERKDEERRKEEEEKVTPKVHAARMGMYGSMTREVRGWVPAKLLCKRFGVREPEVDVSAPDVAGVKKAGMSFAETDFGDGAGPGAGAGGGASDPTASASGSGSGTKDVSSVGYGEDDGQGQDILAYEKPSMDIFKAIFASDEEDSDDEDAQDKDKEMMTTTTTSAESKAAKTGFTPANAIVDDTPVDPDTFKPVFVSKSKRKAKEEDEGSGSGVKEKDKEKKKKKKEKKSKLVSFQMDEEEGDEGMAPKQPKDRPKKKRKKEEDGDGDGDDEGMERKREKGAAEEAKNAELTPAPVPAPPVDVEMADKVGSRARKRAIDFM
ncbi:hypothetical protein CVT24_011025 [Panaeolus cyanescens]|uniref:G-patch domain-containing protein n=1 Tax=Panaeolus cyanescens TaxID=181874 RepID=A0A409VFX6_9AGAR|nr:hypothetical protein CVT24_011025 [Panaeolus cyanescens]